VHHGLGSQAGGLLGLLDTLNRGLENFSEDVLRLVLQLGLDEVLQSLAVHAFVASVLLRLLAEGLLNWL